MPTDTQIKQVIINKLTEAQYDAAVKDATELYLTPDVPASTTVLGPVKVDGTTITATADGTISSLGADTDLSNLTSTGKAVVSNLPMPSDTYQNLTLGASGSTYTMPADGWLWVDKTNGTSDSYILFRCSSLSIPGEYTCCSPGTNTHVTLLMPVKKGDVITVNYNATGSTNYFRFIYAQGEK